MHNVFSILVILILWICIGTIVYWLLRTCKRFRNGSNLRSVDKHKHAFLFSPLVRMLLESFLYYTISSVEEFRHFDVSSTSKTVSFVIACIILSCSIIIILVAYWKWKHSTKTKNYTDFDTGVLRELSSGIKPSKWARFYATRYLIKRFLTVIIIIALYDESAILKICLLLSVQLIDTIMNISVRPFIKIWFNLIEWVNQVSMCGAICFLIKQRNKSEWNSTQTDVFIWLLISNSALSLFIMFVALWIDIISLLFCCKSKNAKNIRKVHVQHIRVKPAKIDRIEHVNHITDKGFQVNCINLSWCFHNVFYSS